MRETPFAEMELLRGAVFGEVCGYRVALRHELGSAGLASARGYAGIVDLSAGGRIKVTGKDRVDLLQRISTNDLRILGPGWFLPTLFVTAKGRIVDRALVFDRGESMLLLTSPAGRERLRDWIDRFTFSEDVRLTDVTRETAALAVTGPASPELLREIAGVSEAAIQKDRFLGLPIDGVETMIARYDSLPSAWLFLADVPGILSVYERALASGEARGLVPIGVEEAEVLRVEAGIPADGHELTEDWNPWEVRLEASLSLTKGCYTGQEVIARLNTYEKVQRRLVGVRTGATGRLEVPQRVYARTEDGQQREIGTLTSAVFSDRFGEGIGLAVLRTAFETPGTEVSIGEGRLPAIVSSLPFA